MDYYMIVGMVLVAISVLFTFYLNVKKDLATDEDRRTKELEALNQLNINIVKLSSSIENMKEKDLVRDKRIDKHGEEIDEANKQIQENKVKLTDHETRIYQLENKR